MSMDIGFIFEKGSDFKGPGSDRLRIILREDPTNRHYDPLKVSVRLHCREEAICREVLSHPWNGPREFDVCEGRLIMEDWRQKSLSAYTLGGEMHVTSYEDETELLVSSCAPIFDLNLHDSDEAILANRLQMELARIRALYQDDYRFSQIVASLGPCELYIALLNSIRFWLFSRPRQMRNTRMVLIVEKAIAAMKAMGRWRVDVRCLEEMFNYPVERETT